MSARIHQISISPPPRGGVPKLPVRECLVTRGGLEGDWQNDRKHHGGPERAVCLFSLEVIRRLRAEGHPIGPGTTGENLTIEGMEWTRVLPGTRLLIGATDGIELEVASYANPCATIRDSFTALKFKRIEQELHPGESRVYARVVREGVVRVGDGVTLVEPDSVG